MNGSFGYNDAGYWKNRAEAAEDLVDQYREYVKSADEALQFIRILRAMVTPEVPSE